MTELAPITGKATLDVSDFRSGIKQMQSDLAALARRSGTVRITADLSAMKRAVGDIDQLRAEAARPIKVGADGEGLRDVNRIIKELSQSVKTNRDLWQTQVLTDEEAAQSAARLRNELLKLAAAEDTNADAMLRATQAAAQAQRTLNQARGEATKGGFAFNASLGILDALGSLGGPAGAIAAQIGGFITQGLTNSLDAGKADVAKESGELSDEIVEKIKQKLQIRSPSRVMEEIGVNIVEGLIKGFKSDTATLLAVVRQTGAQVPAAFEQGAQGLSGGAFGGLTDGLEKTGKAAEELKPQLDESEAGIKANINGAEELALALAPVAAGVLAFGAALTLSIPKAAEFQKAMQAIAAESDLTAKDLNEIGQGLLQVSNKIGTSSIALAKASYDIVGAGVKGAEANSQIVALAHQSAVLAGAGMTEVGVAADVLTSSLNAYGLSAANAERVSDVLFQTTNVGKITLAQMGGTINEILPLAASLGVNLETLSAGVATLTSVGVPAEQAVTGLQGVLQNILNPSDEAKNAAVRLSVGFDAATLKAKGLTQFLKDVAVATQGSTAVMSEFFGDVNAINAVFALTSDVGAKKYSAALEKMAKASGAAAKGFEDAANTFTHSQEKFRSSIENLQITFASRYLPTLTKALDGTSKFIQSLDKLGQNGLVQLVAITGGATLLASTFIKVGTAAKAAAGQTALFQAIANAGGLSAYLASLGGIAGAMTAVTTATVGATVAAAPLAVVAAAVGTAFAGWKIGEWIGELKLFGDETTTLNDKLTDFFATVLFGADPKAIKQMREAEEAEQRRALAAGKTASAYGDTAKAIRAQAEAEAQAIAEQNKAAAAREATLNTIRAQKTALDDLNKSLKDREFKLKLTGKSELQRDLAEINKVFDELAAKARLAFKGKEDDPQLAGAIKGLQTQRQVELAAARSSATAEAAKIARASALEVQKAELDAMREGAAKTAEARRQEIETIRRETAEKVAALADFPVQQAALEADAQKVIAAKRRQWAQEDVTQARENAQRVQEAEQRAADARITAMADGLAKDEALRAQALQKLKKDIADRVAALKDDPTAQAKVRQEGQTEVRSLLIQQQRDRVKAVQDAEAQVTEARNAARAAEIAAIQNESARTRAQREEDLRLYRENLQKRLKALQDYPKLQAEVLAAGQREIKALQEKYTQEDIRDAKERARRIADAFQVAQQAQQAAQAAGRNNQAAQYELTLSRQLAAAKDNVLKVAQLEAEAVQRRAADAEREAQIRESQEKQRLEDARTKALESETLSASERQAIWTKYYADLNTLEGNSQADQKKRLQQREEAERNAVEQIRLARIQSATAPVDMDDRAIQRLQNQRQIALNDAEILQINNEIAGRRETQLRNLRGQLLGLNGIKLNAQERQQVEDRIEQIQQGQRTALQEQIQSARALVQATMDRLDAEAAYAARTARTDQDLMAARMKSLSNARSALAQLDKDIAGEGRQLEQNNLIAKRFALLERIQGIQEEIDAVPLAAQQRLQSLMQAQRAYALETAGLTEDAVARARESVQQAQEEVSSATQKLARAQTQGDRESAATELLNKQTALTAAQRGLRKTINDEDAKALDLTEARLKAELQLRDLADDAIAAAEMDLALTRQRLNFLSGQSGGEAEKERIKLLGQQAEQERRLQQAQKDRGVLLLGLTQAQRALNTELLGGTPQAREAAALAERLADARQKLTQAEQVYQQAYQSGQPEKAKTATEGLTAAIQEQRAALLALADTYRNQLSEMDGVREAAERLKEVAYGESGQPFNFNRERERLLAIQARRDSAQTSLASALRSGQLKDIQAAAAELTTQEQRYRRQAELFEKNGGQLARTGEKETQRLADQVDALGIQYDRESILIAERVKAAETEAQAAQTFATAVNEFSRRTDVLAGLRLDSSAASIPALDIGAQRVVSASEGLRTQMQTSQQLMDRLGQLVTAPASTRLPTGETRNVTTHTTTITNTFEITQQPGQDARAVAREVVDLLRNQQRRSGKDC